MKNYSLQGLRVGLTDNEVERSRREHGANVLKARSQKVLFVASLEISTTP
jgi:hypothetical protein